MPISLPIGRRPNSRCSTRGRRCLDFLPEVDDKTSPEVRVRLTRIRQKLQQAMAEAAVKPSLITLKDDAMPLSKVIAALAEQSGNKINDHREQIRPAGRRSDDQSRFRENALLAGVGSSARSGRADVVSLRRRLGLERRREKREAIAARPRRVLRRPVPLHADPSRWRPAICGSNAAASLHITVETAWEPRLKPIALRQKMEDIEAVDDKGNRLKIDGRSRIGSARRWRPLGGRTGAAVRRAAARGEGNREHQGQALGDHSPARWKRSSSTIC